MNQADINESQFNLILREIKSSKSDLENIIVEKVEKSKEELKKIIQDSESKLCLKIDDVSKKVYKLEQENIALKKQIEYLERANKRKNLIIFGLDDSTREVTPRFVCEELNKLLDIQINSSEISDLKHIGRPESNAIKVEFTTQITKRSILQNCKKLKGTKVTITQDLTPSQLEVNKVLRRNLSNIRKDKSKKSYIRGDKLFIDDIGYSVEDLENKPEITAGGASDEPCTSRLNINRDKENKKEGSKDKKEEKRSKKEEEKSKVHAETKHNSYKTRANVQK